MLLPKLVPDLGCPCTVVYLTVIKIQLKCSLLCDTIPELSRKNWPCFHCVSNPVPSPRTYPLYSVYIHLTASIIYLSIGLSPLLSYELVEGKDPHSSLYLKHSAWYRVVDGHIDEGINIQMDSVMSWSAPSSPPKKKKKKASADIILCGLVKEFGTIDIWVPILKSLNLKWSHLISLDLN